MGAGASAVPAIACEVKESPVPCPSFPEKCNSVKDAKMLLLKMIVDAETDGELKAELPLLKMWLREQQADEVRRAARRISIRARAPPSPRQTF